MVTARLRRPNGPAPLQAPSPRLGFALAESRAVAAAAERRCRAGLAAQRRPEALGGGEILGFGLADLEGDPRDVLFADDTGMPTAVDHGEPVAFGFYWTEGIKGLGWAANAVPTLKGGSTVGVPSPPAVWLPSGEIVTIGLRDAERLQGFPADWTLPAEKVAVVGCAGSSWATR